MYNGNFEVASLVHIYMYMYVQNRYFSLWIVQDYIDNFYNCEHVLSNLATVILHCYLTHILRKKYLCSMTIHFISVFVAVTLFLLL